MIASIDQLLETLANPEGRFKTLEGIHLESENGEPHYSLHCGGAVAVFRVWWNSRPYELRFPLKDYERRNVQARQRAAYLQQVRAPYLAEYLFRGGEMLLFDASERFHYVDMVLAERPQGVLLGDFLAGVCDRGERASLVALRKEFCRMAAWLLRTPLVHGALKPANIIVMPGGAIRLVNYEAMCVPQMDDYAEHAADDRVALANLALGLTVLSASPEAYRALNGNSVFRTPVLRSSLLHLFDDLARQPGCGPMRQLTQMLQQSRYTPPQGADLSAILEALADDPTEIVLPPRLMERIRVSSEPVGSVGTLSAETEIPAVPGPTDLSAYDWAGPMAEALICVQQGTKWGYLHSSGEIAIPLQYDWADDFLEGRAVVCVGGQFGLIDKEGREVLPPIYESIDWDCRHGVARVSYDGKIGLYDRNGDERVTPVYDWMGDVRESELLLVRKDGLCGYIRHSGEVAIPLQYEDAFDFGNDSLAQVTLQGRPLRIDMQGREVCT